MHVDLFFPARGRTEDLRNAREVCVTCPVSEQCRAVGMNEKFGIWGGLSERQRRRLRASGEQLAPVESQPPANGSKPPASRSASQLAPVESQPPANGSKPPASRSASQLAPVESQPPANGSKPPASRSASQLAPVESQPATNGSKPPASRSASQLAPVESQPATNGSKPPASRSASQLAPVESQPATNGKQQERAPHQPGKCGWCQRPLRTRSYCDRVCASKDAGLLPRR